MKIPVFILFLFVQLAGMAQPGNLVPNPSFEDLIECPTWVGQVPKASHWFQPAADLTPDLYSSCAPCCNISVPKQWFSYQKPKEGENYVGIYNNSILWEDIGGYKEYIGVELLDTLETGVTYYWCYYVSLLDHVEHACNNLGIALSTVKYDSVPTWYQFFPNLANFTATDHSSIVVEDSLNWVKLSGSIVAQGGEKYMYIGNFLPNNQTLCNYIGTGVPFWGSDYESSYYYIDCVYFSNNPCPEEEWDTIEDDVVYSISWPNIITPNSDAINDFFKVELRGYTNSELLIYNRWGQIVYTSTTEAVWNGNFKDNPATEGVYYIVIKALDERTGEKIQKTGTFQLVR